MSVVDVDRLTKSFDGRQALCAVTFSLQPGERLVVAGAPGCGRTTLPGNCLSAGSCRPGFACAT